MHPISLPHFFPAAASLPPSLLPPNLSPPLRYGDAAHGAVTPGPRVGPSSASPLLPLCSPSPVVRSNSGEK